MVNSCRSCHECARHHKNYCPGMIVTCNATDVDGIITYGGYSDSIVVEEHFAVKFLAGMPLDRSAPLLCAGITVYSPMKRFGLDVPGKHIRVVGLGGLGHVAVKFGKAFGAKVTVISTSPSKRKEVAERLGADAFLVSKDPDKMKAAWGTMDGIINTVSAAHDVTPWLFLLKTSGQIIMVGAPLNPLEIYAFPLLLGGKSILGSIIGGMKETQEMIDFADQRS
ncbi:probable mannitol dehydrogenase [Zingiber officinale]|uniref:probable mannitol dehydrogenase n=1 Tax=Zingiber officinale TaxID=94328 RepID=UPI001C4B0B80|nr:probable mannitol dehydrogenase [Zingiber officinale]